MFAYVDARVFNGGTLALLIVMNALGIICGPNVHRYAEKHILSM